MLKHFLKDGLGSRDPASRSAAIARLDAGNAENQQKLAQIASTDDAEQVCLAAISRLTDVSSLAGIIQGEATAESSVSRPESVCQAAKERLESLIAGSHDGEATEVPETEIESLLATTNPGIAVLLACHSESESLRQRALEQLVDVEGVVSVAIDSRFHATRAAAAARLESVASMETALAGLKTRDKVVARSLQARIKAIVDDEKARAAHQQDIEQLLESIKGLAASVWSPQYSGRLTALMDRWGRLDPEPDPQQLSAFSESSVVCEELVRKHQQLDQALNYCHDSVSQLDQLASTLTTQSLADLQTKLGELRQEYSSTTNSWRISQTVAEPPVDLVERQAKTNASVQALLDDLGKVKSVLAPDDTADELNLEAALATLDSVLAGPVATTHAKTPLYTELLVEREKLSTSQRVRQNENQAKIKSVQKLLAGGASAIGEKRWSQANSLIGRAQKKLEKLKDLPEARSLTERLQGQEKKLQELGDWVDFAARPKLEALCEQMEALPGKGLKPKELAPAIKQLQQQWKSIGIGPCSNELWPRFKTAGDKAFEPCAAYFAARGVERTAKADNKRKICEQLDEYLAAIDWDAADWKTVEKTLRVAKNEWRNNRITDRKPDKELEQRFTSQVNQFNEKLNAQYDLNAEAKQELIEKARALGESEISQHVVNQARRLQTSWKQTGIMRRKQDQALWEEFNGICRQIHKSHRDVEKAKSDSGLAHVKTAREIIKKLRVLARAGEPDEKSFTALQDEFNSLAEFPERDRKFLFRDFNQASEQFSKLRDNSSARHAQSELQELKRKSALCERYELLLETPDPDGEKSRLDAEWDDEIATLPRDWNKKIQQRKETALQHLEKSSSYDYEQTDKARRLLCIRAEILTERDTPAEDKSLRMAFQLETLQQGLGQSALTGQREALREMQVEWLTLPPTRQDQRERLEQRFQAACE
ncbi:MAG: DUF349 domain-containing protein [Gammaproteobacteria bacterium]|nr:DUF349 domain-containing protein [Gammaproteobacteria bacterium]